MSGMSAVCKDADQFYVNNEYCFIPTPTCQISASLPVSATAKLIDIWMLFHVSILTLVFILQIVMQIINHRYKGDGIKVFYSKKEVREFKKKLFQIT